MNKLNIKDLHKAIENLFEEVTPIDMATMIGLLSFEQDERCPLTRYTKTLMEARIISQAVKDLIEEGIGVSPGAEEKLVAAVDANLSAEEREELVKKRAFLLHFATALDALCASFTYPPCIGSFHETASEGFVENLETVFQNLAVCARTHGVEVTFNKGE